jgi:CheY-like chemotaxis protein
MTAILGYLDFLLDSEQPPAQRVSCVEVIRRNGEHLLSILDDILEVSRLEAGRITVERVPCSPCQIVEEVVSLMSGRATEKGLDFATDYRGLIPETIATDPTRLRQVLTNLIGNAIKFTESGEVRVIVGMQEPLDATPPLGFEVVDTGIGIPPDQQSRIFEPFNQASPSTTRRFGGTGLGLTICKRMTELLGGEIAVSSSPGRGSTFSFSIDPGPLSGVRLLENPRESLARPEPRKAEPTVALEGRVLLAEDAPDNRRLIVLKLQRAGIQVDVADNGRIAVEKVLAAAGVGEPYDVVLMDVEMPELDGRSATLQLRGAGYNGPVIALTAHALPSERERCLRAGCDDYLSKPIEWSRLLSVLGHYLCKVQPD